MVTQSAQDTTLKAYDAIAPLYAEYSEKYRAYLNAVDQLIIDRLSANMRLLDIGSGDGRRLKKITDHHHLRDVVSIEPSAEMAARCRSLTGFPVHPVCGDELAKLDEAPFDAITVMWNVFGHMPDSQARLKTLSAMAKKLKSGGRVMLDVNNRHNGAAYGKWNVLKRRIIDALWFDEKRGDAQFEWKIGNQSFPTRGHLFTPHEIETLFRKVGLRVVERLSVHYQNGTVSTSPYQGQLFYVLMSETA